MANSTPVHKKSSVRQVVRYSMSWLVLSIIFGVLGAVAAFFGAALLFSTIVALLLVGLGAGFLISAGGAC